MEQQPHGACEYEITTKNQVTSISNWPSVLLLDLAHKQCDGIIDGGFLAWHHSQKKDFLSIIYCLGQHVACHGGNPISFHKT